MESSARSGAANDLAATPGDDGRYRLVLGCGRWPGWRGELWILGGILLLTCVLTWPMVATLGQATGTRGDYFNNLWNAWWVKHSLVEGHSPYWTDYLYFPEGISLRRHTLSLLNSVTLALFTTAVDEHQAFNLLLLLHFAPRPGVSPFARSQWCTAGGLLGGWSTASPVPLFYLADQRLQLRVPAARPLVLREAPARGRRAHLTGVVPRWRAWR
jgi:hypothetical protein